MTTFEVASRNKKAEALIAVLRRAGVTSHIARIGEPEDWALVAKAANVNPPSQTTINLVIRMLEASEVAVTQGGR
jgi:hypothetical protein